MLKRSFFWDISSSSSKTKSFYLGFYCAAQHTLSLPSKVVQTKINTRHTSLFINSKRHELSNRLTAWYRFHRLGLISRNVEKHHFMSQLSTRSSNWLAQKYYEHWFQGMNMDWILLERLYLVLFECSKFRNRFYGLGYPRQPSLLSSHWPFTTSGSRYKQAIGTHLKLTQ